MNITFALIKKNLLLSASRWLCLILCSVFLYFDSVYPNIYYLKILIGSSLFLFAGLTLSFSLIIKRFKIIGSIKLDEKGIEITGENGESTMHLVNNKMKIYFRINGYRGESLQNMYIVISEGIGRITIENNNQWIKYYIFVDKDFRKKLSEIADSYKSLGAIVDFGKK